MFDALESLRSLSGGDAVAVPAALLVLHVVVAVWASCHILLTKENVRAAVAWIGLVLLSPLVGAVAYWIFGINRVRRRFATPITASEPVRRYLPLHEPIEPLVNGDEAFPAMLDAIAGASRSVALSTYIFDRDESGLRFVEALSAARDRGVAVRVLVDDVGIRYSRPPIDRDLAARGIRTARFMPVRNPSLIGFVNLRSHRKVLVIDGEVGFVGGMNIRHGNCLHCNPAAPVQDVHFRVTGPVVDALAEVFEQDWEFATGETVHLPARFDEAEAAAAPGRVRMIADGPDDGEDRLQWAFLAALGAAGRRARIVTPYFLPNEVLTSGIEAAIHRGIEVEIVVPRRSNLFFFDWPMAAVFEHMVARGARVYLSDPPFDHSKIFLVDEEWCSIGSSNWDDRSFRLNFELNLEVIDARLAARLNEVVDRKKAAAQLLTLEELRAVPLPWRLRNRFARLFSPYL